MDYNALRAQTLGSGFDEEAVTVNTRALIDKVLARYSGEWTVLRELLQNAADAVATKVTVKFETNPSPAVPLPTDQSSSSLLRHTVQHHTIKRLIVSNNGQPFNENDWNRLKRIAEGNPDETKIGAFGVGFYSTFADCEEPFVSSGKEAMAFFWKNNSLFTRRLKLSDEQSNQDTTFVLDYRDTTSPIPTLLPLAQFLASSLTFVGLENLELWLDDWKLLSLNKKASPTFDIPIPRDVEPKTSEGFMKVQKVTKEVAQIDGQWMKIVGWKSARSAAGRATDRDNGPSLRKFFSRLAGSSYDNESRIDVGQDDSSTNGLSETVSATVFLNVNTATIKTFTGQKFNEELERATKKPPPKYTHLAILTAPYIENDTVAQTASAGDVFGTVLPTRSGKIFIGFPTHQTTGLNAHISAPSVIPTVEREAIDLNARYVRTWNTEMLRTAGIVCRIAWHSEMSDLKDKIIRKSEGRKKIRIEDVTPFLPEAITTFKNFTFRESTPSAKTGQILEDAFWTSGKKASIEVLSTCGVLPTHDVRIAPKDLSFMDGIPILPDELVSQAELFIDKLVDFGLVTEVTVSDIKKALEANALTATQVGEFLAWLTKQAMQGQLDASTIQGLLAVAIANVESSDATTTQVIALGSMQYFLNPSRTPVDLPVPPDVVPFKFTRNLSKAELESIGWQELQIVPWVRWLLDVSKDRNVLPAEKDLTGSATFAAQVLPILSKQWDSLSQSSKQSLINMLSAQSVIPTVAGMKKPGEAYFPNVKLFDDLPTITGLPTVKDKFLAALGVRKTVELGVVFARLLQPESKEDQTEKRQWSHIELIQYLASVRDDIPREDIQKLKNTPIVPRFVKGQGQPDNLRKFKVSEVFEPRPELRDLGLPVLSWQGPYKSGTPVGKLLTVLGLRTVPRVEELIEIMATSSASDDLDRRDRALAYFLSHHHAHGYGAFDYASVTIPFLPLENKPGHLATPSQCYLDEGASLFGFDVLKRDWVPHGPRLGVAMHPPIDVCINLLGRRPPRTHPEARTLFAYFSARLPEITGARINKLNEMQFVPIFSKDQEKQIAKSHVSPRNCFLGESETFGDIFNFVDFGMEANSFLLRCGSKQEPTKFEVAQILVKEPARISSTFKNPEKYLTLLRNMAESLSDLRKSKDLWREMKRAPFLLASKEIPTTTNDSRKVEGRVDDLDDLDEEEALGIREYQLCNAESAIIVDDYINYNLFKANILAAPQEETLENFYNALGSPTLSSLVEEAARHGPRSGDQRPAQKLQKQIHERSRLFLHDQPPEAVKHDTRWLEKNLQVALVSSITLRRSLKGRDVTHSEKRSAVITQVNREYTLWVTGEKPDLYQVSQALVHLLLNRPRPHSALTLETLLKHDLLDLRARGFNVSRILRQRAAEARLAESKRQQELEEEQKRIEEQEKLWKAEQEQASNARAQKKGLPGGFPDSPDSTKGFPNQDLPALPTDDNDTRKGTRNLFSNISKQFGLGNNRHVQSMLGNRQNELPTRPQQALTESTEQPPPYSYADGRANAPDPTTPAVSSPHQLQQNLLSAIQKTRPHNSGGVYSRGETNVVSETKSYCDERPGHDLNFVAEIRHGIQMFVSATAVPDASAFLREHNFGLMAFANVLKSVADVFSLNPRTLNIFYETSGKTIAFNRSGAIFCNYLYFQQLHEKSIERLDTGEYGTVFVYWWVIFCHELAHNLVGDHSSDHSYYTEGFVGSYFGKVLERLADAERVRNDMLVGRNPGTETSQSSRRSIQAAPAQ